MCFQVFIKHEGEKISLIVDGINVQSKRIPAADRAHVTGTLYVGGVPSSLTVKHITHDISDITEFILVVNSVHFLDGGRNILTLKSGLNFRF